MTSTTLETKTKSRTIEKVDYAQIVTDKIIDHLKKGVVPWKKPWNNGYGLARNYITGHEYRGINMFMLNLFTPYEIPFYLSRKQIKDKGGHLKKGSKAEWVYFYKKYYKDANNNTVSAGEAEKRDDIRVIKFLKTRPVFNIECTEGIEIERPEAIINDNSPIESCEQFLTSLNPTPDYFATETNCAVYNRVDDNIRIPDLKYFDSSEEYYCTLLHEIIHWTGGKSRLSREGVTSNESSFGTKLYAEEELIAELGACFLCSMTGISNDALVENNAAYIQSWIKRLEEDKNLIFRTAAKAQKAIDYLMPKKEEGK